MPTTGSSVAITSAPPALGALLACGPSADAASSGVLATALEPGRDAPFGVVHPALELAPPPPQAARPTATAAVRPVAVRVVTIRCHLPMVEGYLLERALDPSYRALVLARIRAITPTRTVIRRQSSQSHVAPSHRLRLSARLHLRQLVPLVHLCGAGHCNKVQARRQVIVFRPWPQTLSGAPSALIVCDSCYRRSRPSSPSSIPSGWFPLCWP